MDVSTFVYRAYQEQVSGKEPPQDAPSTFLARIVQSNPSLRGGEPPSTNFGGFIKISGEEAVEKHKTVANILGLAVVISVQFAQGIESFTCLHPPTNPLICKACALAVDLYLRDEYQEESNEIIRLSTLSQADTWREDANKKIMGYIRKAQSQFSCLLRSSLHVYFRDRIWKTNRTLARCHQKRPPSSRQWASRHENYGRRSHLR
jgi:hypothetical protein